MIGIGLVVGLNPPWVGRECGMAPVVQMAAAVAKVSLGCLIGAVAGLLSSVKRGAVAGLLIGGLTAGWLGSPISITSDNSLARFAIGAVVGTLIGALSGLAGKTTPIEDRRDSGYKRPSDSELKRQFDSDSQEAANHQPPRDSASPGQPGQ
jgi:hypothetical protein